APFGSVALGPDAVWTAFGDSTLTKILPATARKAGSTLTGAAPAADVVGGGFIWVANSGDATVQRFDPATFQEGAIKATGVSRQPVAIAYGAGAVWVACRGDDVVTRIDPATNSTITIPVGHAPIAVDFGGGAVWVANSGDGTI